MNASATRLCLFGLGEAGGLIGADLAAAGLRVRAYDPRELPTPAGITRCADPVAALQDAEVVVALTAAADAETALQQAYESIPDGALYADFSTATPDLKQRLGARCALRGLAFVDVAITAIVPGNGLRAPTLAAGPGANRFVELFGALGMPTEAVSERAGDAATRKLLRSVMMKGLAALLIESMQAAEAAGCADWLWRNMGDEISRADERTLSRLVRGTHRHALRRLHEMEASTELLQALEVDPLMTRSTTQNLKNLLRDWPEPDDPGAADSLPGWWSRI